MQTTADVGKLKWLATRIALKLIGGVPIVGVFHQRAEDVPTLSVGQHFTSDPLGNYRRRGTLVKSKLSISGRGDNRLSRASPLMECISYVGLRRASRPLLRC